MTIGEVPMEDPMDSDSLSRRLEAIIAQFENDLASARRTNNVQAELAELEYQAEIRDIQRSYENKRKELYEALKADLDRRRRLENDLLERMESDEPCVVHDRGEQRSDKD